ncbi:GNAT family N-acetyltransferase [Microbulbifer hainanensis]|uniref:hypothetical protein n=1 Tax=Microbulbifer hainanensis TaxID=2735675 RepID=UPI001868B5C0|nr:hypothetical protein [Microbulbifer hainanensis]
MSKKNLDVFAILKMSDFLKEDFQKRYEDFLGKLAGFYPWCFSSEAMRIKEPLFTEYGETPFFITVTRGSMIVAFFPMQIKSVGSAPFFYRRLRIWGQVGRYNDNYRTEFLCLPEYIDSAPQIAMSFLAKEFYSRFDEITFGKIVCEGPFYGLINKYFKGGMTLNECGNKHIYNSNVKLETHISGNVRQKIRRAKEKLHDSFSKVEYLCYTKIDPVLFEEISEIHIKRQQHFEKSGKSRMNFLADNLEREIFFNKLVYAEKNDALRIYVLRVDSKIVCFLLCFGFGGFTDVCLTAFTEVLKNHYMSRSLWYYAFDQEISNFGAKILDSGYGTSLMKSSFSTETKPVVDVSFVNKSNLASRCKNSIRSVKKWMQYRKTQLLVNA